MRRISLSRGKRPKWMIEIAIERMNILFERAEMEFERHPERSNRYVVLAKKLSTKYNTKIPDKWARRYCKRCNKFLYTGHNATVRLVNEEVNILCGECGHVMKIPYHKEKNKDDYIADIVQKTRSKLIDVRGNVAVIYKKKP